MKRFAMTKITIVFDNYAWLEGFKTLWGFSCFVEAPEVTFLFDTGSNGRFLLKNMARLGVDPKRAEALVISHRHWDHIGGIDSVLEVHPDLRLYLPASLSKHLIRDLEDLSGGVTIVGKEPTAILPGVVSTGIMGEIGEQSAVIPTPEGLVVITGCAHPGVVNIAERAVEMTGEPIALLMGGFHLMYSNEEEIAAVIERLQKLGVRRVCPTHCSGDLAIEMFAEAFGEGFVPGGIGKVIEL